MYQCIHCQKKIGWFKRSVDGGYCSDRCRGEALEWALRREQEIAEEGRVTLEFAEAEERARVREKLELEAASLRTTSEVVRKASIGGSPCPKCGTPWVHVHGAGALGRDSGDCGRCGFRAEFIAVEQCPNCRCQSLVVESEDDARCPRCKSRPRRRRQIA